MGVKAGYKQSEVGQIPSDWQQVCVGDIAKVKGGKRLPAGYDLVQSPTPHPYIRVSDMFAGGVNTSDIRYVPVAAFPAIQRYRIYTSDIFISVAGTLGIVGVVPSELNGANLTENADRITEISCNRDYLKFWLLSRPIQRTIDSIQTVGAQPKLALSRIAQFFVALPSRGSEQDAIAEALSDADALLGVLDRLIAKKRDLKRAAMQQLLSGQTRLPDFVDRWEVTSLDMITSRSTGVWGKGAPDERNSYRAKVIRAGDITQDGRLANTAKRFVTPEEYERAKCTLDDLVITASGNGLGKLWWCDGRDNIVASNFVRVLRPKRDRAVGKFLLYVLRTEEGLRQLQEHTATSAYPNLRPTYFTSTWIPLPHLREQSAIAALLSDMDAEIDALEARRIKTRDLKQAMMQELLTGRTRLI
jgi:type I restriction enzyme S subunit